MHLRQEESQLGEPKRLLPEQCRPVVWPASDKFDGFGPGPGVGPVGGGIGRAPSSVRTDGTAAAPAGQAGVGTMDRAGEGAGRGENAADSGTLGC